MTPELFVPDNDPFGYLDDLRDALADRDLFAGGATRDFAAYQLALARGRCLLYGITAEGDLMRPLAPEHAAGAAGELCRELATWIDEAAHLGERWEGAVDPAEGDEYCARLLQFRMDLWAAEVALDRSLADTPGDTLEREVDRFDEAVGRFDLALEGQADLLSTITGTRLLDNWRAMLAEEYREDLPWWLDGTLEDAARRLAEYAERSLPGPRAWAEVRRQADRRRGKPAIPWPGEDLFAAADTPSFGVVPGKALTWISPDGTWRAEVRIPDPLDHREEATPRPLNFTRREDDAPASVLAGRVVHVGEEFPTIDVRGKVEVRLVDLRSAESIPVSHQGIVEQWLWSPQGD